MASSDNGTSSSGDDKSVSAAFTKGQRVRLCGLQSEEGKKLNGQVGVIQRYLADSDRWKIIVDDDVRNVKAANLKLETLDADGFSSE